MWLYIPSTPSVSAPVSDSETSDLDSLFQRLSRLVTSNAKLAPSNSWSLAWKKGRFTRLRSSLTLPSSMADRGVELYIQSLRPSPVLRTPSPENNEATKTSELSGQPSLEWWQRCSHRWYGLKTYLFFSSTSSQLEIDYRDWATQLRSRCSSQLRRWERLTNVKDFLLWPTSRAEDSESCGNHPGATDSLTGAIKNWGTPRVTTNGGIPCPESTGRGSRLEDQAGVWPTIQARDYRSVTGRESDQRDNAMQNLNVAADNWLTPHGMNGQDHTGKQGRGGEFAKQATNWPTPRPTDENMDRRSDEAMERESNREGRGQNLALEARSMWMTPQTPGGGRSVSQETVAAKGQTDTGKRTVGLESQSRFWPTPNAHDGRRPGVDDTSTQGGNLQRDAAHWGTPTSRDWKDGTSAEADCPTNGRLGLQVIRDFQCSPPAQEQLNSGNESSEITRTSLPPSQRKRLNVCFALWLMGAPLHWLAPEPLASGASETELWLSNSRRHLESLLAAWGVE